MQLSEIEPGAMFVVRCVNTGGEIGKRLADMGFTEGTQAMLVRSSLFRGPIQVRLRGYDLLIRTSEAACIRISLSGADGAPLPDSNLRAPKTAAGRLRTALRRLRTRLVASPCRECACDDTDGAANSSGGACVDRDTL